MSTPQEPEIIDEGTYRATVLWLWEHGKHFEAMKLLWRDKIIDCPPTRHLIEALASNRRLFVLGHGAASKTFTTVAFALLRWYTDPKNTSLMLTSATRTSLASRAWADLKLLHRDTAVPMPGMILASQYKMRYDKEDDKHTIQGVSGEDEDSESKIRGLHAKYNYLIIDEADNPYNAGIWKATANLGISGDFNLYALSNPVDRNSIFGQKCEPERGWDSIDINTSFDWTGRTGLPVLRLDGLESPNIKEGKTLYPFLITQQGINDIISEFGEQSPVYFTQVRGWFPPLGSINTIFNSNLTTRLAQEKILFYSEAVPVAACDPSLGGGDRCVYVLGRAGLLASDPRKGCVVVDKFIYIKRTAGHLYATVDFAKQIKELNMEHGVAPEHFAIDSSAATQGIADYLGEDWSNDLMRVNFGGACSRTKILQEDSKIADDRFDRFVTELWWGAREWTRAGLVQCLDLPRDLRIQLESRRWGEDKTRKNLIRAETKDEMKLRGLKSPDEGDAFCLLVLLVRRKFGNLEATTLDFDPAVRKENKPPFPKQPSNREMFEPSYKHDGVLSGRKVDEQGQLEQDREFEHYSRSTTQDLD